MDKKEDVKPFNKSGNVDDRQRLLSNNNDLQSRSLRAIERQKEWVHVKKALEKFMHNVQAIRASGPSSTDIWGGR